MPGYILHLTAAKMYLDKQTPASPLRQDEEEQNDFYIGNLLPDTVCTKNKSHFRDSAYRGRMMEWPHPERFRRKYSGRMNEAVYQGYYFHLCIDKYFFRDYIPEVVTFYDDSGRETDQRDEIRNVLIKKSGECVAVERYLSEDYYYGDYTKMNTWLCEKYSLPDGLRPGKASGIAEADDSGVERILAEIEEYRKVPADAVKDLKVFEPESLTAFLEKTVQRMLKSVR